MPYKYHLRLFRIESLFSSVAVFRISSGILPHFVWISKQNYNFPYLFPFLISFSDFSMLHISSNSTKSGHNQKDEAQLLTFEICQQKKKSS